MADGRSRTGHSGKYDNISIQMDANIFFVMFLSTPSNVCINNFIFFQSCSFRLCFYREIYVSHYINAGEYEKHRHTHASHDYGSCKNDDNGTAVDELIAEIKLITAESPLGAEN